MICKNCNAENQENAVFCCNCGARLTEEIAEPVAAAEVVPEPEAVPAPAPQPAPAPAPQSAPAPAPQSASAPQPEPAPEQKPSKVKIPSEYYPVSSWGFVGLQILYSIPVVGLVFLLIHTFSKSNLSRRNFARSIWCWVLLAVIFSLICLIVGLVLLLLTGIGLNELANGLNVYY